MKPLYLSPSEIRFSQDSINNVFDNKSTYRNTNIGETLDALCEGRSKLKEIPTISVVWKNGHWFTLDNRRLWVFRHLERLRKCNKIPVKRSNYMPVEKFTTTNDGKTIEVRGEIGGRWHKKNVPPKSSVDNQGRCNGFEMHTGHQNVQSSSSNKIRRPVSKPRISSPEAQYISIPIEEPEEHDTSLHKQLVPDKIRQKPNEVYKSKKNGCSCVIL
ncbi:hypothetical protein ACJMK2_034254 [Sinanodonta woodiana]|uniref:Uncharacterized protein n=1 Tax=Sinanodonta woodiana TaxID=1069815 RepID=A0ABD3WSB7_SINWO